MVGEKWGLGVDKNVWEKIKIKIKMCGREGMNNKNKCALPFPKRLHGRGKKL